MSEAMFGKAAKGKVLHIIVGDPDKGFHARCDKKLSAEVDAEASIHDVSCARCKTFAIYKNATTPAEPVEKPTEKDTPPPKEAVKEEAEQPSKSDEAVKLILDRLISMSESIEKLGSRVKSLEAQPEKDHSDHLRDPDDKRPIQESDYKDFLKEGEKPDEVGTVDGKQFRVEKSSENAFRVVHIASGNVMFNNVQEKVIKTVEKYLNNLKVRWENKNDPIPKDFVSACATAFKAACDSHGVKVALDTDPEQKPPRVIKRREKSGGRRIKRREKKEEQQKPAESNTKYGFRANTARGNIALMLEKGMSFCEIHDNMTKDFQYTEKQTRSKLSTVIRKLVKQGLPVMTIKQQNGDLDYFQIIFDDNSEE